jgi:predicted CXXCH cytochrome family protein
MADSLTRSASMIISRCQPVFVLRVPGLLAMLAAVLGGCGGGGSEDVDAAPPAAAVQTAARPVAAPIVPPPAPRPTGPLAADATCINAGCHATYGASRFVHGVLWQDENCSVCHEPDQGGHEYPLKRPGNETCLSCHDSVTGGRPHGHMAADVGCTTCHEPHASDHRPLLRVPAADLCRGCHPSERHAFSHPPFAGGECVACHEPHESDFAGLLRGGEGAEHCYLCHEDIAGAIAGAALVHAPAAQACNTCHSPHGSDHPHLLGQAIETQCLACHGDIEKTVEGAEAPHGALSLGEQCANCHDAHASSQPSLLKDRQDVLCLRCHDEPIVADDGRTIPSMTETIRDRAFLHGPVESGNCAGCHTVHGGSQSRLLSANFAPSFYASFDLKHYALCFECHESELVTTQRTDALTNFRDGDLNLHYLHVNRQVKGRSCRTCHEVHGSDQPAHIAETVPFEGSGWPLPIGFEKTATGGSCAPGCHKPMGYDRDEPIGWSADQDPTQDNNGDTR